MNFVRTPFTCYELFIRWGEIYKTPFVAESDEKAVEEAKAHVADLLEQGLSITEFKVLTLDVTTVTENIQRNLFELYSEEITHATS
jgi:hypothetical protein